MVTMTTIQPPSAEINFENVIFRGWACQILGRDKWQNRDKTGKYPISQGFKGEFLLFALEW